MEADQITAWISEKRFASFLESAGGEEALATQLYLWHAQVAGASLTTLHHFEVALRNAINRQLGSGEPDAPACGARSSSRSRTCTCGVTGSLTTTRCSTRTWSGG
jgi:hypothetical protein